MGRKSMREHIDDMKEDKKKKLFCPRCESKISMVKGYWRGERLDGSISCWNCGQRFYTDGRQIPSFDMRKYAKEESND